MSWQEELRQLDLQHSQGLLTEQQYRAKREDLLAEASCAPSVRPLRNTPADSSPATRQGRPSAADLLATRLPTTAPSPADERPTDRIAPPPRPARRATRPVATPVPPPPPVPAAPGFPPPGQPHRIGVPKRTQPPWLVVMLGVFVVLTLIIGAMWWIGTLYHGQPSAPATGTGEIPQQADRALIDRLPALPGQPHPRSSTVSADKGAELELYEPETAKIFAAHQIREVTWQGASDGSTVYTVLVAEAPSAASASATTADLVRLTRPVFDKVAPIGGDRAMHSYRQLTAHSHSYRVLYTSGVHAVRIDVARSPAGDSDALEAVFSGVTQVLPPG